MGWETAKPAKASHFTVASSSDRRVASGGIVL